MKIGRAFIRLPSFILVFVVMMAVQTAWPFLLGIENISSDVLNILRGAGELPTLVGLVTNQTGCDQQGNRAVDLLRTNGVRVAYILAPEHGFDGAVPAGQPVEDSIDLRTGIPIKTVYGRGGDYSIVGKRFDPNIMKEINLLCYDVQDVGMRHYTYISTLLLALEAAAEFEKPLVIFDRPNLLGPYMEGPLVDSDPSLRSFVSLVPIPLRHGMTVGELASYFNKHVLKKPATLHVVKMKDYHRETHGTFFQRLSPNLQKLAACYGYSFLGLLGEIRPFNIGVGTSYAFQAIMLSDILHVPAHIWIRLQALLKQYDIRATHHECFKQNNHYRGLHLRFASIMKTASFRLFIDILQFFRTTGLTLTFSNLFDKAIGTTLVRRWYHGELSKEQLAHHVKQGLAQFMQQAQDSFLYEPHPHPIFLD